MSELLSIRQIVAETGSKRQSMEKVQPTPKWVPRRGEKVCRAGSDSIYVILEVHHEGRYVDMFLDNTDLEWFSYPAQDLRPVAEKKPAQSSPTAKTTKRKSR